MLHPDKRENTIASRGNLKLFIQKPKRNHCESMYKKKGVRTISFARDVLYREKFCKQLTAQIQNLIDRFKILINQPIGGY